MAQVGPLLGHRRRRRDLAGTIRSQICSNRCNEAGNRQNEGEFDTVTPGFRKMKDRNLPASHGKSHRLRGEYFYSLLIEDPAYGVTILNSGSNFSKYPSNPSSPLASPEQLDAAGFDEACERLGTIDDLVHILSRHRDRRRCIRRLLVCRINQYRSRVFGIGRQEGRVRSDRIRSVEALLDRHRLRVLRTGKKPYQCSHTANLGRSPSPTATQRTHLRSINTYTREIGCPADRNPPPLYSKRVAAVTTTYLEQRK